MTETIFPLYIYPKLILRCNQNAQHFFNTSLATKGHFWVSPSPHSKNKKPESRLCLKETLSSRQRSRQHRPATQPDLQAPDQHIGSVILSTWAWIALRPLRTARLSCGCIYGIAITAAAAPIMLPASIPTTIFPLMICKHSFQTVIFCW